MDIRTLRYFLAVAREGSLSAAARTLYITHPALSKQMSDLESELGVRLFERKSRGVSLTHEGVMLRSQASQIVSLMDRTMSEFSSMASRDIEGTVRICSGEGRPVRRIAHLVARIRQRHPKVHVQLHTSLGEESRDLLDKGMVDFRALIGEVESDEYDWVGIPGNERWGVIVRADSPIANKGFVTPHDLVGVPVACPDLSILEMENDLSAWFGDALSKLDVAMTFDQIGNVLYFVAESDLAALTLDGYIYKHLADEVSFVPLEPALEAEVILTWRRDRALAPAAQLFLDEARREFSPSS